MQLRNSIHSWGLMSQSLHWLIALLIFLTLALGLIAHEIVDSPAKIKLFILHKSLGITVLGLVVLRLIWKLSNISPAAATAITPTNDKFAQLGHWALYGLMFALPITGWVLNSAANIPFKWMNLFAVPNLPGIEESWKYRAYLSHWYLALLLMATVGGHAVIAVVHHIKHGSNVLLRMLPVMKPLAFLLSFSVTFGVLLLLSLDSAKSQRQSNSAANADLVAESRVMTDAEVLASTQAVTYANKRWSIQSEESKLDFVGGYDGVPFNGEFKHFTADMFFDPENAAAGFFDVIIDTTSVTTFTDDWDSSLPAENWFFTSSFPQASYKAVQFKQIEGAYLAEGVLTLKGVSKRVPLQFTWVNEGDGVTLEGTAIVNRRDFNIGTGAWLNDETIAFDIAVNVNLKLKAAN